MKDGSQSTDISLKNNTVEIDEMGRKTIRNYNFVLMRLCDANQTCASTVNRFEEVNSFDGYDRINIVTDKKKVKGDTKCKIVRNDDHTLNGSRVHGTTTSVYRRVEGHYRNESNATFIEFVDKQDARTFQNVTSVRLQNLSKLAVIEVETNVTGTISTFQVKPVTEVKSTSLNESRIRYTNGSSLYKVDQQTHQLP